MSDKIIQTILEIWVNEKTKKPLKMKEFRINYSIFKKSFCHLFGDYNNNHLLKPTRLREYRYLMDKQQTPAISIPFLGNPNYRKDV